MYKLLICLLLIQLTGGLVAQNLVLNPSFEEYDSCGQTVIHKQFFGPKYWYRLLGSSDYFIKEYKSCYELDAGSGGFDNIFGYSLPRTGKAYCGIYPIEPNLYQEHLVGKLRTPLYKGQSYKVSFYVYLVDVSAYSVIQLGAYLSKDSIEANFFSTPDYSFIHPYKAQVQNQGDFLDKEGWQKVEGVFEAKGGEEFITIGFLGQTEQTIHPYIYKKLVEGRLMKKVDGNINCRMKKYLLKPNGRFKKEGHPFYKYGKLDLFSYYYIDDVSVVRVDN